LGQCCALDWRPVANFAPPAWSEHGVDQAGPVRARFELLDRSALFGSRLQRDIIWIVHLCAGLAVLAAVIGEIYHGASVIAASRVVELLALITILGLIILARRMNLQERWTACRLGAEQLRIARMCLPLLALPPALTARDTPVADGAAPAPAKPPTRWAFWRWPTTDLTPIALAEVKRVVRDQGLPSARTGLEPRRAAKWLQLIVGDQASYHDVNHRKLEQAEKGFLVLTAALFFLALVAVLIEFSMDWGWLVAAILKLPKRFVAFWGSGEWLLLFTAAGPAFAAAFQGAETRLGIVHRAALSKDSAEELKRIDRALCALIDAPPSHEFELQRVRDLALDAADAMGSENVSWHALLRRERDTLPA
jgi:hypothetical protein